MASARLQMEAVVPGLRRRVFSSDLQGVKLQKRCGVQGHLAARSSEGSAVTRLRCRARSCVPVPGRGTGCGLRPSAQRGSAPTGTRALPLAGFLRPAQPGNRGPWDPLPAYLPLGRPQANK